MDGLGDRYHAGSELVTTVTTVTSGSGYVCIVFRPQHGPGSGYVGICLPLWRGPLLYLVGQIPKSWIADDVAYKKCFAAHMAVTDPSFSLTHAEVRYGNVVAAKMSTPLKFSDRKPSHLRSPRRREALLYSGPDRLAEREPFRVEREGVANKSPHPRYSETAPPQAENTVLISHPAQPSPAQRPRDHGSGRR